MWYYVLQIIRGSIVGYGGYKSREAACKRYEKVKGGEVYLFASGSDNLREAIREFKGRQALEVKR